MQWSMIFIQECPVNAIQQGKWDIFFFIIAQCLLKLVRFKAYQVLSLQVYCIVIQGHRPKIHKYMIRKIQT